MLADLRYSVRSLLRAPSFFFVAILTLALGIGAATAIFSVVYGVLLRPLPFPEGERMVQVWQINEQENSRAHFSHPNFVDMRERVRAFGSLAQYSQATYSVLGGTEPVRAVVSLVSKDFFDVVATKPALGRTFTPDEQQPGGPGAVIVSHAFWQRALGGDAAFAGRTLTSQGMVLSVIGVMPPGFEFPVGTDIWVPSELFPAGPSRTAHNWNVVGRLAANATLEQAQAQASNAARQIRAESSEDNWMVDAAVIPLREQMVGRVRVGLLVLLGAAGLLLLIAGANVVNLLLARATTREAELALRLALGADRRRLTRLFLSESLLLAGIGGLLGVLLATWGVPALLALEPGNLPRTDEIGVNTWILLFAITLSLLTAVLLGVGVVRRAITRSQATSLVSGRRSGAGSVSSNRTRQAMVAAQVALTVVLLIGATLLSRSFLRVISVEPGFRTSNAVLLTLVDAYPQTPQEAANLTNFHDALLERLARIPGVEHVGGANDIPLGGRAANGMFGILTSVAEMENLDFEAILRDPSRLGQADYRVASPGYFAAMEIPLIRGRLFDERDAPGAPHVAVISKALADQRWPNEDPIGKVLQFGNMDGDLTPMTIVGIVGDVREYGLEDSHARIVYANSRQRPRTAGTFTVVMAGSGDPAMITSMARTAVREMRPDLPPSFMTIEERLSRSLAPRRFSLFLLGAFGVSALILSLMGIYGVTAYTVAQRTQEIGIRIALGAHSEGVVALIVGRSVKTALIGLAAGLAFGVAMTRVLSNQLFGISALDPATFALVATTLIAFSALSAWLPSRKASRVDPAVALRNE